MGVLFKMFALVAAVLTVSCGGGGGGGGTVTLPNVLAQPTPNTANTQTPALSAAKYAGSYLSICELIPDAVNLETNTQVYGRLYQVVGQTTTASASLNWRIDIYDSPVCSGSAVGYIENKNAASRVTIVGQTTSTGVTADKVIFSFGAIDLANAISVTPSSVVVGTAIRLSLPSRFFSAFEIADIWFLQGTQLYEGIDFVGADGFPLNLDLASPNLLLLDALPLPPAPCMAKTVSWQRSTSICNAALAPTASGLILGVTDSLGLSTGSAEFSCSNGEWSLPNDATCADPPPPPAPACAPTRFTWTVGGNTCSGLLLDSLAVGDRSTSIIPTDTPGYSGYAPVACNASLELILDPLYLASVGCTLIPPPKPRTTAPLQLATEKNCMACHTLSTDAIGPSFKKIADHYRTSPPPALYFESKVKYGGIGVFGNVPMPANPQVDDIDIGILKSWILSQ